MRKKLTDEQKARILHGMEQNALKGNFNGGIAPFGYELVLNEFNRGQIVIYDKEAEAVVLMFKRAARRIEPFFISQELLAKGHLTRKGDCFDSRMLRRILTNERYIGIYVFGNVRAENVFPAIVPKDLFETVGKTKRYRRRNDEDTKK